MDCGALKTTRYKFKSKFQIRNSNLKSSRHTLWIGLISFSGLGQHFLQLEFWYRVDRQCCSSGNRPETNFLAKSLVIPAIFTKFKLKFVSDKVEFCLYGWNYQWFSKKNPGTPLGGSPGGLRTISAGTTLPVHTVCTIFSCNNLLAIMTNILIDFVDDANWWEKNSLEQTSLE